MVKTPFHGFKQGDGFRLITVFYVVYEESKDIEESGKPNDNRNEVKGL